MANNELHWLAGFLDGEGHFGLSVAVDKRKWLTISFYPFISVQAIKGEWEGKCISTLKKYNIHFNTVYINPKVNRQATTRISIHASNAKKLAKLLLDKTTIKAKHCKLLSEFKYLRLVYNSYGKREVLWDNVEIRLKELSTIRSYNNSNKTIKWTMEDIRNHFKSYESEDYKPLCKPIL